MEELFYGPISNESCTRMHFNGIYIYIVCYGTVAVFVEMNSRFASTVLPPYCVVSARLPWMKNVANVARQRVPMLGSFEPCWKITTFSGWRLPQGHYPRAHFGAIQAIACGVTRLCELVFSLLRVTPCEHFTRYEKKNGILFLLCCLHIMVFHIYNIHSACMTEYASAYCAQHTYSHYIYIHKYNTNVYTIRTN